MVQGIGPLDVAAIAAGKAAGAGTRLLRRGGGTALPGLVAERVVAPAAAPLDAAVARRAR